MNTERLAPEQASRKSHKAPLPQAESQARLAATAGQHLGTPRPRQTA